MSTKLCESFEGFFKEMSSSMRDLETLALLKSNPCRKSEIDSFHQLLCSVELQLDELETVVSLEHLQIQRAQQVISRLEQSKARKLALESLLHSTQPISEASPLKKSTNVESPSSNHIAPKLGVVDEISLPSLSEFEKIPRYMRKPLHWELFLRICQVINSCAKEKSRIVFSNPEDLNGKDRVKQKQFKANNKENSATALSLTEDDMTSLDGQCTLVELRTALECLRHLGRIRLSMEKDRQNRYILVG